MVACKEQRGNSPVGCVVTRVQEKKKNAVFLQVFYVASQAGVAEGVVSLLVTAEVAKACRGSADPQYRNSY